MVGRVKREKALCLFTVVISRTLKQAWIPTYLERAAWDTGKWENLKRGPELVLMNLYAFAECTN